MIPPMRQAEPAFSITDVWPLEKLIAPVMAAYDALAKKGEINVVQIRVSRRRGLAAIEYLSTLPKDWTHQALARERDKVESEERNDQYDCSDDHLPGRHG